MSATRIYRNQQAARRVHRAYMQQRPVYRVVTEQRGSWKWQDAYRIATYRIARSADGKRLLWKSVSRSAKYSMPQLLRVYDRETLPTGSLHNREVRASHFDVVTL